ncbi:LuxR family transcriptional regulator, maltose regulon positive regulatory protein [Paenibacillus sp. yr247]|nr:LuxR family transcriptional regulator, maltose regulon positive regulatory protein [Paenibacillus sp. yr247]
MVLRSRLTERLSEGLHRKLTLVSASAGFGKTTLVSEWLAGCKRPAAWLSLDEGDNDPARFLTYLLAALQTIGANIGEGVFGALQSPQPPAIESVLTVLLNEITTLSDPFILVLDDYHLIETKSIDHALAFLLDNLPPQMHLVIATRKDPRLPMARMRVRDQLTELRVADLRFTHSEAAEFLNKVMALDLSSEEIARLETRTEGWIAGLQLAAVSMQGHKDAVGFIETFTGSHRFVLDYLVEEVLQQQSEIVQSFLLCTSILDRICGPLCDAVLQLSPLTSGQETLEDIERANLFIIPLDNERRWYRYHHLFADLLRRRLDRSTAADLHLRASVWYEQNGLEIEAFHHAVAAGDVERAACLTEGDMIPLHFRGAVSPVLNWLSSLPKTVLDTRPSLRVIYASALLMVGQLTGIEQQLQATESSLQGIEPDEKVRDIIGHIASIRATVAVSQHQVETILVQSHRALEYLHPGNLPIRTATTWTLGYAYQLQGDRAAASSAFTEALSISQMIGHVIITIMATLGLGNIQEAENQLYVAVETYRRVLKLAGDPPQPVACEAHLGLARIFYEWNDLDAAKHHGQQSVQLARHLEHTDRVVAGEVFLARLELARGEVSGASAILAKADHFARQHNFVNQMPHVAAAYVLALLQQGNLAAAAHLAQKHELHSSKARVHLAQGDTTAALAVLEPLRGQVEAKGWEDERLKVMVLQAVALHAHGEKLKAAQILVDALTIAKPGGFIRIFVDEGIPMYRLLWDLATHPFMSDYIGKLLAEFDAEELKSEDESDKRLAQTPKPLIEPLSGRELEVLQLIAQGLSNREISERLFLALSTVKGHNRNIFDKMQVGRRTEAVALARKLGLL